MIDIPEKTGYWHQEGIERLLEEDELNLIIKTWKQYQEEGSINEPKDMWGFFGITREQYDMLEENTYNIFIKKEALPIRKHLIYGLCNILVEHLSGGAMWRNESEYRLKPAIESRIERLKKEFDTEFNYKIKVDNNCVIRGIELTF